MEEELETGCCISPASSDSPGATTEAVQFGRRPRKLALVLSGGGSLGCVQVGVVEAPFERGLIPDMIVGTSVGALNPAWLARHATVEGVQRLKEVWASLKTGSIFTGGRRRAFLRMLLGRDYLYTNKGLRDLITRHMGDITFEDLSIPLFVTAANLDTGELAVLHQGPLVQALLASTAIPGVFPPVVIHGYTHVDGGILSNCSIETAWQQGASHIVVVECPYPQPGDAYGIIGPISRALWVSLGRLCQLEVERFRARCPVLLLWPDLDVETYKREDFTRTMELIGQAKEWAVDFLNRAGESFLGVLPRVSSSALRTTGPEVVI